METEGLAAALRIIEKTKGCEMMRVGCLNLQPSTSLYRNVTLAEASSTMADMCMGVASADGTSSTKLWKCVLMSAAQLLWFSSFCR